MSLRALLLRIALILVAIPSLYFAAGLIVATIPANDGWREADQGVTIYVETNGVHTGIVVPLVAEGIDWRPLVSAADLADPRYAGTHLSFGWGERRFYLNTPTWADLDLRTAFRATIGSDTTLLHVDHVYLPEPGPDRHAVRISRDEYRRLAAFIRSTFALTPDGLSTPIPGYGPADVFYEAHGHYNAFRTCNWWVGEALRQAGIRVGLWTPFAPSVMMWFEG